MKIVSRQELLAMPAGTLYHEWQPLDFGRLRIKGESILHGDRPNDWWVQSVPILEEEDEPSCMETLLRFDGGARFPVTLELEHRDGLFDDTLRYAVWEYEDVRALYAKVGECMRAFD